MFAANQDPLSIQNLNECSSESAQSWWESITNDCDAFFEIITTFDINLPVSQIATLLMDLEMSRERVMNKPYPIVVQNSRQCLLDAMASVRSGIAAALGVHPDHASVYVKQGVMYLNQFNRMLDQLGVS